MHLSSTRAAQPAAAVAMAVGHLAPLLDSAPLPMALVSTGGQVLAVNDLLAELTGVSPGQLVGMSAQDVLSPGQVMPATDDPSATVRRFVGREGREVVALTTVRVLHDADGCPLLRTVAVTDVTERVAGEREMAELGRAALAGADEATLRGQVDDFVGRVLAVDAAEATSTVERLLAGGSLGDHPDEAGALVNSAVNVLESAARRRDAEDALRHQALHDPLTGLPNRLLLADRAGVLRAAPDRGVALLLIDLDCFAQVNDTHGHLQGDVLLREIGRRVRQLVRPEDTVVRLGGDEFAVLLVGCETGAQAEDVAARLLRQVSEPVVRGSLVLAVGASIGIAHTRDAAMPMERLLRDANLAMHTAKSTGRGQFLLCTDELRATVSRRRTLEVELSRAIDNDELVLHFQPVVRTDDGTTVGLESLVRWQHPELGLIGPADFVPLAEAGPLVERFGAWVLESAVAAAARFRSLGPASAAWGIGINVSARQLVPGFVERVLGTIARYNLRTDAVVLELTETVLLDSTERNRDILTELRRAGVRVAIDDFGTGYSSLSYLVRLPVDIVKLDRSFIAGVAADDRQAAVVGAVVRLAADLGLVLIAEGVERADQRTALLQLGCELSQGWYYARPMPAEAVERRLARR